MLFFWSFCYLDISFLFSNIAEYCRNLKKLCSSTIRILYEKFRLISPLLSGIFPPIIQLGCHKFSFYSLMQSMLSFLQKRYLAVFHTFPNAGLVSIFSDLNFSTISCVRICVSSFVSFSTNRGRNILGIWGKF